MKEVNCPDCGEALICEDVYDTDPWDESNVINYCYCRCSGCGKNWKWQELFTFVEAREFEENEE